MTPIPPILFRTVPEHTTQQVEDWWEHSMDIHPGWIHQTHRDPLHTDDFPITGSEWHRCSHGAQKAGLIRLELLWTYGGVYIDSDVELYRPLDPLLGCQAFAGWEDSLCVPDAVIGATPGHPAIGDCLREAVASIEQGPHASGPTVTTNVFRDRPDVLLLPPGSFYPYHYSVKDEQCDLDHKSAQPWAFGAHHWAASWLPEK